MRVADWYPSTGGGSVELAAAASLPVGGSGSKAPDMAEFQRQYWNLGGLDGDSLVHLATIGAGYGPHTRPDDVPWEVLDAMGYDPVIYLGERALTSVADDHGLYRVQHDDPRVRAEVEAWLTPILSELVSAILPAFAYGCAPVVLDFERDALETKVPSGPEGAPRKRTIPAHTHYSRVHSVSPSQITLRVDASDRLVALTHGRLSYEGREQDAQGNPVARRAFLPVWDRRWGGWHGMASRRRAYKAWYTGGLLNLWQSRYLERSVDVPRIGFAPKGNVTIGGEEVPALRVLTAALMSLKNGSACVIPSEHDANNNQLWRIEPLQLPDRSGVWTEALSYWDAKKLEACLMPPGIARGEDVLSSAKVADSLMRDFVQGVAEFVAAQLTVMVRAIHRLNGGKKPYPVVAANEIPQARRKLLLEVLKATVGVTQRLPDGRVYTLGELIDPEILDTLGIKARPVSEAARKAEAPPAPQAPGGPGRPRDTTSEREARRDAARTDSGEDATGAPDEGEE